MPNLTRIYMRSEVSKDMLLWYERDSTLKIDNLLVLKRSKKARVVDLAPTATGWLIGNNLSH